MEALMRHTYKSARGGVEGEDGMTPRQGRAGLDLVLHDFDSLSTVDSGEAGGDAWTPCRDNLRIVLVEKKRVWRVFYEGGVAYAIYELGRDFPPTLSVHSPAR